MGIYLHFGSFIIAGISTLINLAIADTKIDKAKIC